MKYRNLLVILLVGIFMISGTSYALSPDTDTDRSQAKVGETFPGGGGAVAPKDASRLPDGIDPLSWRGGGRGVAMQLTDLRSLGDALEQSSSVSSPALEIEFNIAAKDGSLPQFVAMLRSNLDEGENQDHAINNLVDTALQNVTDRGINVIAFDADYALNNTADFIIAAGAAQEDQKQVVIVALNDEQEAKLLNNEKLNDLEDIYISKLSGNVAAQWNSLLAGANFLDLKNMQATKMLENKDLIKGLATAK